MIFILLLLFFELFEPLGFNDIFQVISVVFRIGRNYREWSAELPLLFYFCLSHFFDHKREMVWVVFVKVCVIKIGGYGAVHTPTTLMGFVKAVENRLCFRPFSYTVLGDTIFYKRITLYLLLANPFTETMFFISTISDIDYCIAPNGAQPFIELFLRLICTYRCTSEQF